MTIPNLLSSKLFSIKHPTFTIGSLRHLTRNQYVNGLFESHAIVRIGRRLLIDEKLFFEWAQGTDGAENES